MVINAKQSTRSRRVNQAVHADIPEANKIGASTVVQDGLLTTLWGLGIGAGGAWFVTEAMRSIVFEVAKTDFSALAIVVALLMMTSAFAALIPANRAAGTDPMQILKSE